MTSTPLSPIPTQLRRADAVPVCPYVGLVPFTESDEAFFFGRERDRDLILANLTASRLTLLYAPSGIGKSSVLRAGVLPLARRLSDESYEDLGVPGAATAYVSDWTTAPLETVAAAVVTAISTVPGATGLPPQAAAPTLSAEWLGTVLDQSGVGAVHLVLDQFEEYFLYHREDGDTHGLVAVLGHVLSARDLRVNVLMSIREDALATLDRFKGRIPHLFDNYLRLAPLDQRAGRRAIHGPLEQYDRLVSADDRLTIEPALVDALLDQVRVGHVSVASEEPQADDGPPPTPSVPAQLVTGGQDGGGQIETPYLQLVLTRLWHEERASRSPVLRLATLTRLGGAQVIVRTHLDQVMEGLTAEQIAVAAAIFHHLVTKSGSKIASTAEDLAEWAGLPVEPVRDLLDRLSAGRQRILRPVAPTGDSGGPCRYEIYHDVMGAAVLDWRRRHVAQQQRTDAEQRLVEEREQARTAAGAARRRLRRIELVAAGMALLLVVMAALGVYAIRRDREARQQGLLSQATATLTSNPGESLSKAVAAYDLQDDADAREAVLAAAGAPRGRIVSTVGAHVQAMIVSRDGKHVVTYDTTDGLRVLGDDGSQVSAVSAIDVDGTVAGVATSSDAATVALASDTGDVWAVDTSAGTATHLIEGDGSIRSVSVLEREGAGSGVLVWGDGSLRLFDPASGTTVTTYAAAPFDAMPTVDGLHVVTSEQGLLRVWDSSSGQSVAETAVTGVGWALQAYGTSVAGMLQDGGILSVFVWDLVNGSEPVVFSTGYHSDVSGAWVDEASGKIVIAADKEVTIYRLDDGTFSGYGLGHSSWVYEAKPVADGRWVVSAGGDGRVLVWPAYGTHAVPVAELIGHRGSVLSVDVLSGGARLVSRGTDGTVRLWDVDLTSRYDGHTNWVDDLDQSPDGQWLLTSSSDGRVDILGSDTSTEVAEIVPSYIPARADFDPADPHRVVTLAGYGTSPELWRWQDDGTVEQLSTFDPIATGWLTSLAVSPDGNTVAGGDVQGSIHFWDARTGTLRDDKTYHSGTGSILSLAFDPTGELLAAATRDGSMVWTLSDGDRPRHLSSTTAVAVAFSRAGDRLAVSLDGAGVDLWTREGEHVRRMDFHGRSIGAPAFSKDGRYLAAGTSEGMVEVHSVESGRTVMLVREHSAFVNGVAFREDPQPLVVSASDDSTVAFTPCAACIDQDAVIADARDWVAATD